MRLPRFTIKRFTDGACTFWGIWVPMHLHPNGRGGYFYFHTKADAELKRAELIAATRQEIRASALSGAQTIDAQRALEKLTAAGVECSLSQAVDLALPLLKASGARVSVDALLADFAQVKAAGWSALSARNFGTVSRDFLLEFSGRALASVTVRDLQQWLSTRYSSTASRLFAVRTLRPAWSFAVRQGMLAESPWQRLEPEKAAARESIDIYTPAEARRLLECAGAECQAAFAVLLFAGIRPAELTRLKWGDLRDGFIHVRPSVAKTRQVRNVPIEPTLVPFLAGDHAADAHIVPPAWRVKAMAARTAAGLSGRPDAARHSYATYFLARGGSVDALKSAMGHSRSSDVLFAHYRAAATPAQAAEYWGIVPPHSVR